MNWNRIDVELMGNKDFLEELDEIILSCVDEAQKEWGYNTAHITKITDRLHVNSKLFDIRLFVNSSYFKPNGHLVIEMEYGTFDLPKDEFQKGIEKIFENNGDKISGINYKYYR